MRKGSIPLNGIRVFVEIVRQRSVTQAAKALGISQSAASKSLAALEEYAGKTLITRSPFELTPQGLQFYELVEEPMTTITMAAKQLAQSSTAEKRLVIRTSMTSLSTAVLIPLTAQYSKLHNIEISVLTSLAPPVAGEEFDILISRDLDIKGVDSWNLYSEKLVCVGHPDLVAHHRMTEQKEWPLIATRSRPDIIPLWCNLTGVDANDVHLVASYDHLFMSISCALQGLGFLVAPELIVQEQIKSSVLVPTHELMRSGQDYSAYISADCRNIKVARDFCMWLKTKINEEQQKRCHYSCDA